MVKTKKIYLGNIVLAIICGTTLIFIIKLIHSNLLLSEIQTLDRDNAANCDSSFFQINSPAGQTFTTGCTTSNTQIYDADTRYSFFQIESHNELADLAYIKTPNAGIKDNIGLNWSVSLSNSAHIYILTRHIPGISAPNWIKNNYQRATTDDLSNINQYALRKNDQGLIGLYDIWSKDSAAGSVVFEGAADSQTQAYSMYMVALAPLGRASNSPLPTNSPTPSPTGGQSSGQIKKIWIVMMENTDWAKIKGSASFPYVNSLLPKYAHAENYKSGLHPSLPNYIAIEAGDALGLTSGTYLPTDHSVPTTDHLTSYLNKAGRTWKLYSESLPGNGSKCNFTDPGTPYSEDHNAFAYFQDVSGTPPSATNQYCIQHERPYSELQTDISNNSIPDYSFIVPNDWSQGEKQAPGSSNTAKQADDFLAREIPKIQASSEYKNGAILILWDESSGTTTNPHGLIVVSPFAKVGYQNTIAYSHSSTLRTMQEIFKVTPFIRGAATANDLSDLFTVPL